jgi:hypothetical protein
MIRNISPAFTFDSKVLLRRLSFVAAPEESGKVISMSFEELHSTAHGAVEI